MDGSPALPTKFPCWCRAVYSWGGETKKDLGFVEGDLIECLNAGDGQWWMGRLRRDKRAMGFFPSNFVKVLDDSFVPVNRTSGPMIESLSNSTNASAPKVQSVFRKPFQAYSAPIPQEEPKPKTTAPTPGPTRRINHIQSQSNRRDNSLRSNASRRNEPLHEGPSRQHSRSQNSPSRQNSYLHNPPSRQNSYLNHGPDRQYDYPRQSPSRRNSYLEQDSDRQSNYGRQSPSRQGSFIQHTTSWQDRPQMYLPDLDNGFLHNQSPENVPGVDFGYGSLVPSPAPPIHQHISRAPSPAPFDDVGSPPPPPPPHRVAYNPQALPRTPSPQPSMNEQYRTTSRGPSPIPNSPGVQGHTPSPLRDAMDDVMSSLHDMAVRHDATSPSPERSPSPLNPWSPEAFEELRTNTRRPRPQSSLGTSRTGAQNANGFHDEYQQGYVDNRSEPSGMIEYTHRLENNSNYRGQDMGPPPLPPTKGVPYQPRPTSPLRAPEPMPGPERRIRSRKSAFELGKDMIGRTFTTKSTLTNASSATQSTTTNSTTSTQSTQSVMSGQSAGAFSATSAGSLARHKWGSIRRQRPMSVPGKFSDDQMSVIGGSQVRSETPLTGISYHSSHDSRPASTVPPEWAGSVVDSGAPLGGLAQLRPKKSGFLRKLAESAKTSAANARRSIAGGGQEVSRSPVKGLLPNGVSGFGSSSVTQDMGFGAGFGGAGSGTNWMQVRRDVNRSNSLSRTERNERAERCELMDQPIIPAIELLAEAAEGDEGLDGLPVAEPTDFQFANLQLVDKSARFIATLPPMTNATSLAQGYVCRPYRSDVQRLRAIFTWVSEKVAWEEEFEGAVDSRRVIQTRRGCAEEVAVLVMEMCQAVGLHAEAVRGYLKPPGELPDLDNVPRPNHWWNAVLVDGEWRIMDCSLASPTNPRRSQYSSASAQAAESWYFLARPLEACYTHVPQYLEQQHICPPISPDILLALPCACPPYFKNNLQMPGYDTSLLHIEGLELMHIYITAPPDVELFAEVEAQTYARDVDGDLFESGDTVRKQALAQADWQNGIKRYTIKAALPSEEGSGMLKIYAGKRGLMHSIKDNPYPLAVALPIIHTGENPPFEFLTRHPTPHAQRHDLYVAQPQCKTLACNNTFVFAVRQHPSSSLSSASPELSGKASPLPFRPESAMSMSSTTSGSNYGGNAYAQGGAGGQKPAKLAVQAPSGKILRMSRKVGDGEGDGGTWETVIKVGEKGTWRGLVLADRSARWCVFGEWECV